MEKIEILKIIKITISNNDLHYGDKAEIMAYLTELEIQEATGVMPIAGMQTM